MTGGWTNDWLGDSSSELVDTNGTNICSLPDLPSGRYDHTQDGLTLCGGYHGLGGSSCQTFSTGSWIKSFTIEVYI